MNQDLELAMALANIADEISMRWFGSADLSVETKSDGSPVTAIDHDIETQIRAAIADEFPADGVIGEEFDDSNPDATRQWILDPIDGTKAYMRGHESWATLIALEVEGEVTVAVASAPSMRERYHAVRGGGAFLQAKPIHVSQVREVSEALLSHTGIRGFTKIGQEKAVEDLARRCWDTRGAGNSFTHLSVAKGTADIGWTSRAALWDYAALSLIVTEAGGKFHDGSGRGSAGPGVSSNPWLYAAALSAAGIA